MTNPAKIIIIDYGSGNLRSVAKAFEQFSNSVIVSSNSKELETASHIVLPGVGAFADCMAGLLALPNMIETMEKQVLEKNKNFIGICVGMQMLFERGHEHGIHDGLGWIKGEVVPITPLQNLKIPHIGWNELEINAPCPILSGIKTGDHAYFVHSYHAKLADASNLIAGVEYGEKITAIVGKNNIYGTQFHPEKSQKIGLRLLENFVNL